jgi:hypothetical protein
VLKIDTSNSYTINVMANKQLDAICVAIIESLDVPEAEKRNLQKTGAVKKLIEASMIKHNNIVNVAQKFLDDSDKESMTAKNSEDTHPVEASAIDLGAVTTDADLAVDTVMAGAEIPLSGESAS